MTYVFFVMLVVAGMASFIRLTSISRFNSFFHYKCRYGAWRDFIFIKMRVKNILPFWAYRFGGGPVPVWTWRAILTGTLLIPFWALTWMGLQLNWGYVCSFVGGFVLMEILSDIVWQHKISQIVDSAEQDIKEYWDGVDAQRG